MAIDIFVSSFLLTDSVQTAPGGWEIEVSTVDGPINVIAEEFKEKPFFRITTGEDYAGQRLIALSEDGDELWSCDLEGTDEYDNAIHISELADGGTC